MMLILIFSSGNINKIKSNGTSRLLVNSLTSLNSGTEHAYNLYTNKMVEKMYISSLLLNSLLSNFHAVVLYKSHHCKLCVSIYAFPELDAELDVELTTDKQCDYHALNYSVITHCLLPSIAS